MKRIIALIMIALSLVLAVPSVSYAAFGNSLSIYAQGNNNTLIYIKRRTYTISAVGAPGTKVRVYRYNPNAGVCYLIKNETQIGASGLYSTVLDLTADSNVFMVTAENANGNQVVRIDINKIKKSTVNKLKNVTVTIRNFFGE